MQAHNSNPYCDNCDRHVKTYAISYIDGADDYVEARACKRCNEVVEVTYDSSW